MRRYLKDKGTITLLLLAMLILCGCALGKTTTSNRVVPPPIILTQYEQNVLRSELPEFYIRFTNQQLDLIEVSQ